VSGRANEPRFEAAAIAALMVREEQRFTDSHPKSKALAERAAETWLTGAPMSWMREVPSPFPVFAAEAKGSVLTDVDGIEYADLCMADTGALFGHSPQPTAQAIAARASAGITLFTPTEDAAWVGEELARRFGLPVWQSAITATDANRFCIAFARQITRRAKVLVFHGCYHGSLPEAAVSLDGDGNPVGRPEVYGPAGDPALSARCVEQNDLAALERELSYGDVACVLAEPCLTNVGMVPPAPGWHEGLRALSRKHGALLILDETHTICAGPGGCTKAWGLEPDMLTLGKSIAGGVPVAVYGFSAETASRARDAMEQFGGWGVGVVGSTLAGNALQMAALRATLEHAMTEANYRDFMIPAAEYFVNKINELIGDLGLSWQARQLGARAEYTFLPQAPANGSEAMAAANKPLERLIHLFLLNRGVLTTPFYNVVLCAPSTTRAQVDRYAEGLRSCLGELATGDAPLGAEAP
jgi:glutamate-1-semialdehyde 2,1-aminomutase